MSLEVEYTAKGKNITKFVIVLILLVLLFAPVIWELISVWATDDDYSHGFFVIPLSLWMVWRKRATLISLTVKVLWIGLPLFAAGLIAYYISFVTKFHTVTYLSMILTIFGLLLFLTGLQPTKELLFPLLFLLFMFPIPSTYYVLITNPLKLVITKISAQVIYLLGIPVFCDGNLLVFANTQLEVAEACSGVRSMYSFLMLGCLFGFLGRNRKALMILLVVSTLPLALFINVIRVAGTGIISNYYGPEFAQGFFHQFTGFILFFLGFVFLYIEYWLLSAYILTNES